MNICLFNCCICGVCVRTRVCIQLRSSGYISHLIDTHQLYTQMHILFCFSCCCWSRHCRGHGNEDRERDCDGGGGGDGDDSFNSFPATMSLETSRSAKSEPPVAARFVTTAANNVYTSTNKTRIVSIEMELFFLFYPGWMRLLFTCVL